MSFLYQADEKKAEEPVAGKVCNTVDTPAQGLLPK